MNSASPPSEYLAVLVYLGVALAIGVLAVGASALLGPRKPSRPKLMPYESGNDPAGEIKRFPVHFYAIAMLFIIFDVEIAFLWPYAVSAGKLGMLGFWGLLVFTLLLFVGFIYEWWKGVMRWH
ncbi:MAG: NADH-quinone oxidoreductase subunit A [Deinococcus sp.]|nr:NADH-quinone oxidoreductase subunit A [Deinococcus sp.]MCL5965573.1 NADH-quinone oxidoreductase subunit A [Deinococcus sp.]